MEELVSIVVPVYNVEQYLDRCLQSIVDQTYRNIEIILVDDGSTDNSAFLCDQWKQKDGRIKVIHKQNGGLGMARNTGIDHASGKYVFFLDSDDYVDTSLVEKCVCNAQDNHSEVVIFGRCNVYEDGKQVPGKIAASKLKYCGDEIRTQLLPYMFTYELGFGVSAWGRMYDTNLLKRHDLRFVSEREIIAEDAYFSLALFAKTDTVTILPENLYFYCRRNTSLSRRYQKGRQEKNNIFLIKSIERIEKLGLPCKVKTHIQARYHGFTLGTLMQITKSDLPQHEKREELSQILHDETLRATLTKDVCRLDGRLPRLFWWMLRFRCYTLCKLLLRCNACR